METEDQEVQGVREVLEVQGVLELLQTLGVLDLQQLLEVLVVRGDQQFHKWEVEQEVQGAKQPGR